MDESKVMEIGIVDIYFKALSERCVDVLNEILSADVIKRMPYAPKCLPKELIGPQAIIDSYRRMLALYDTVEFSHKEVQSTGIEGVYLVKYAGLFTKEGKQPYANHYVILIKIVNDVIVEYDEYFDTELVAKAFC